MKIPNFFIVGAPRCGTTSMYDYLRQHSEIFMPDFKEPHYFGKDLTRHGSRYNLNQSEYLKLFKEADKETAIGEASTYYLYSASAPEEILEFNRESKIIIMLRDPVDFIYSIHSASLYGGQEDEKDFEKALNIENDRKKGLKLPKGIYIEEFVFYRSYLMRIPQQIKKYIKIFGKEKIYILLLEDIINNVESVYRSVLHFLDVDEEFRPDFKIENKNKSFRSRLLRDFIIRYGYSSQIRNLRKIISDKPLGFIKYLDELNSKYLPRKELEISLKLKLRKEFRPVVEELQNILGRDISLWHNNE